MKKNQPQEKKVKFQKDGNSAADEDAEELLESRNEGIKNMLLCIVVYEIKHRDIVF